MDQYSALANADLPREIPSTSDFYIARARGRRAIPECFNEMFVTRFASATKGNCRDYRNLLANVQDEARTQGFGIITTGGTDVLFQLFFHSIRARLGEDASSENAAALYCNIFVLAILKCPITNEDIYE